MKFLHAKPNAFLWFLGACTHASSLNTPNEAQNDAETVEISRESRLSLDSLEKLEIQKPFDSKIKMALARAQACRGSMSLAFENWNWIVRFSNETGTVARAQEFLRIASDSREKIFETLECSSGAR